MFAPDEDSALSRCASPGTHNLGTRSHPRWGLRLAWLPRPTRLDSYRFGQIVIDGKTYTKDIIILPGRVIPNWWRKEGHRLHPEDLDMVLAAFPDVLIVGRGASSQMEIMSETRRILDTAGIKLVALPTGEAWTRYNILCQECRAAAALHLTC